MGANGTAAPAAPGQWNWPSGREARPAGLETWRIGDLTLFRYEPPAGGDARRDAAFPGGRGLTVLMALLGGACAFRGRDGRFRPLRGQEALLAEGAGALELKAEGGARLAGLAAPTHLIAPRFVARERLTAASLLSHGAGMASLLCDLLGKLAARETTAPGPGAVMDAVGGLLSATLEDGVEARPARGEAGAARLERIRRHLRRAFADPELSAADAAKAAGVSRRYLHRLFAQHGLSFRDELIALRIEACVRAFQDEGQAGKTIADIAFAAGYTDISQFNRHFRRLKGVTPSQIRRSADGTGPGFGRAA